MEFMIKLKINLFTRQYIPVVLDEDIGFEKWLH